MRSARSRRRRRFQINVAVAGLAGLLALFLLLRLAAPSLLEERVMRAIDEAGLGPARMQLAWHGLLGLRATDLQLGPTGAVTAESADLSFSPAGLAAGRIDALTLTRLHVSAAIDESGHIALQGLPPLALSTGAAGPVSLPLARIILADARLDAATPAGPITLRLDGIIRSGPAGLALDSALTFSLGTARLTLPALAIEPQPGGSWHVRAEHAAADYAAADVRLRDISATLDWTGDSATLDATIAGAEDMRPIPRFPPLGAELHAARRGNGIDFSLQASDGKARLRLSAKGRHDLASGRGTAEIASTIEPFHVHALQPRDLAPALAKDLPPIDGRLGVSGSIGWKDGKVAPRLLLSLADLAGDFGAVRLSGGHAALLLDSLSPPATPPGQVFAGTLSVGDIERLPLEARLQLRRDGALHIESLRLGLADGTLGIGDVLVKPAEGLPADIALPVAMDNVELGELLKLVDIDGLSGQGRLDGLLPLRLVTGAGGARRLLLQQGRLQGRDGGVLRYVGTGLPEQGSGSGGQSVALLRDVLKNFHYQSLTAELDQGADGSGGILLHLDGSNPAVLNGRRFLLNIRLDANFDRLAQIFLSGLEAAQNLTRNSLAPQR